MCAGNSMWDHTGIIVGRNGNLEAVDCEQCGFVHLFPLLSGKQLQDYYQHSFYEEDKKSWLKESEEDAEWIEASLKMELGMLGKPRKGANYFIDIGAGFGQCLQVAQKLGWAAEGLEPSPFACEVMAKSGIPHQQGFIEDTPLQSNSADVIRAAWVLEHLLNPGAVLDKFHKALVPTGKLILTVPNDFSHLQAIAKRASKKRDDWWVHRSHVNYFIFRSLSHLLGRHGFMVVRFYTTYPMEMFLLQGEDYIGNEKLGRKLHARVKQFELAMHQSEPGSRDLVQWQAFNATLGIGRDLVVLAAKR